MVGKTLLHYEITEKLGKGGMGEVYQAKDTKLGRNVAIKVLPEEFARDADRVARFQREAKLLASLNHANIAAIHGLEEAGGASFLVMELVEGETLAGRLKRGAIPVEESLKLALQIAEALEAAHEKGVIHRDLKPANIKVTPEGKVKVLDFGLAKAYAGEKADVNLSNSPTLSEAATQQGVILGTAAYMSPEQARGESVDKRADIWAFGCVLFEMLTGRGLFDGRTVSDILASVLKSDPDWSSLPPNLHPRIRLLVERCLEKQAKDRCHDISDARVDIQKALASPAGALVAEGAAPRKGLRALIPWAAAVLFLIVAAAAVWKLQKTEPRQVLRFDYVLPEGQEFSGPTEPVLAVSPDGKQFAYSTTNGIYLRPVDALTAKLIAGTEGPAQQPFFSPDGKWIGYFDTADRKLKKIAITGGAPVSLCSIRYALLGAYWCEDNTIVFGDMPAGIARISADGGTAEKLIASKMNILVAPQILPDGDSVLFTAATSATQVKIMVQSIKTGKSKELFAGVNARYVPTGHLLYGLPNSTNGFAIPFDVGRLEVKGGAVPVIEGLRTAPAISESGTLAYIPADSAAAQSMLSSASSGRTLVWVDLQGKEQPIEAAPNSYEHPQISPDGTRIAMTIATGENKDVWILDLVRKTLTRLTFGDGTEGVPVWTPDGKRIVFLSERTGKYGVYWKSADGTGKEEPLGPATDRTPIPYSMTSDGKTLVIVDASGLADLDVGIISLEGDHPRKTLIRNCIQPKLSPDGRWIAYGSNESGRNEIFVRPFPEVDNGKWQVSTNGGTSPIWSRDGRQLFYWGEDRFVISVAVETKPTFSLGTPKALFRSTYVGTGVSSGTPWDISPDGKRFLMMKEPSAQGQATAAPAPRKISVVLNWFEELKQRVPVK